MQPPMLMLPTSQYLEKVAHSAEEACCMPTDEGIAALAGGFVLLAVPVFKVACLSVSGCGIADVFPGTYAALLVQVCVFKMDLSMRGSLEKIAGIVSLR